MTLHYTTGMHTLISQLSQSLNQYPAEHYYVGYSGGRDSHVLLDALAHLISNNDVVVPVTAIHVDHSLNSMSRQWVEHCRKVCSQYHIPFIVETVTISPQSGQSIEAFAREARYELIGHHLDTGDVFLSAHHQRDQAETFLLQLMRGAGLDGLRSMPAMRSFASGVYVRPLLQVDFAEILDYADQQQLCFIHDDSNDDTRFDRNFIRHSVMPLLQQRYPQAVASIAQSARWLAEVPTPPVPESLVVKDLMRLSREQGKQAIRAFLKAKIGVSITREHVSYIMQHHLNAGADKHPELRIGKYCIRRYCGEIIATRVLPVPDVCCQVVNVGDSITVSSAIQLQWEAGEGMEYHAELVMKPLSTGARFHPHFRNHSTTIKKIFNECGIPHWLRMFYMGIYLGDELVAIPGIGVKQGYYKKNANAFMPKWIISSCFVRI